MGVYEEVKELKKYEFSVEEMVDELPYDEVTVRRAFKALKTSLGEDYIGKAANKIINTGGRAGNTPMGLSIKNFYEYFYYPATTEELKRFNKLGKKIGDAAFLKENFHLEEISSFYWHFRVFFTDKLDGVPLDPSQYFEYITVPMRRAIFDDHNERCYRCGRRLKFGLGRSNYQKWATTEFFGPVFHKIDPKGPVRRRVSGSVDNFIMLCSRCRYLNKYHKDGWPDDSEGIKTREEFMEHINREGTTIRKTYFDDDTVYTTT